MNRSRPIVRWRPSAAMIQVRQVCAEAFGVSEAELLSRSRKAQVVRARQVACYVLRAIWPELSYPCVAATVGMADHSSALYSVRQIDLGMREDEAFAGQVREIVRLMKARVWSTDQNAHVVAWRDRAIARLVDEAAERRITLSREADLLRAVTRPVNCDTLFAETVRNGVALVSERRRVKPSNELVDDDCDALRRKHASDGLSAAIAAAGGWR